eukprot:GHRQ01023253.1.p1 GENE.GHRQ01023253.1~~GHRQ01023253.1.p1  ORF type:complete len:144 (+),score=23.04 GHRQ01023253.1:197-628(+)
MQHVATSSKPFLLSLSANVTACQSGATWSDSACNIAYRPKACALHHGPRCLRACLRRSFRASTMVRSQDETILPSDFKRAGVIVDDDLNAMLVRPLAPGVTLHALVDACHSGTAMDLPYRAKVASDGRFSWKVIAPAWLMRVA